MALLMVMTVCLLAYAALEYRLRQALADTRTSVPDQQGKPTQRLTMRWVFQRFVGIHVLLIAGQTAMILNLKPPQQDMIRLLGPPLPGALHMSYERGAECRFAHCQLAQNAGVRLVGIDSYNIDDTAAGRRPVHSILLRAGIPIVEHLRGLEHIPNGDFEFFAAPVKVKGMGTFPVRAFVRLSG